MNQDIILTADYHDQNCVIRWRDEATGGERVHKVMTDPHRLSELVAKQARTNFDEANICFGSSLCTCPGHRDFASTAER